MTAREPSEHESAGVGAAGTGGTQSRSLLTVVYTVTTLLGGIAALVVLAFTVMAPEASVLDFLLWGALAVLLFAAAAREWWFKGIEAERSRQAVAQIPPSEIAKAARESSGEIETVRKLRQSHPGLRLVDAVHLVRGQNPVED